MARVLDPSGELQQELEEQRNPDLESHYMQ